MKNSLVRVLSLTILCKHSQITIIIFRWH
jgi:hypothetical protein